MTVDLAVPGKVIQIAVAQGRYCPELYALDENGVIWRQDVERFTWYPLVPATKRNG